MLNAYLMKGGEQKKSNFILTEPYFQKLNSNYAAALSRFMDKSG
jgi:HAE1 family hydrophobic/amphiphilic exporter-1/multidrug efflux pump